MNYTSTSDGPLITLKTLPDDCADFFSSSRLSDYSEDRDLLKVLFNLVGPECYKPLTNETSKWEGLRRLCETEANSTGFAGGSSNRCLHKFLIRYMDYNITAYDTFLNDLGIHLFEHISMYGFCSSISTNATMQKEVSKWALDTLGTVVEELLEARNATMNEERPTTSTASTTTEAYNTTPAAGDKTSTEIDVFTRQHATKSLRRIMEEAKNSALALHGIKGSKAWSERSLDHEKIANATYLNLIAKYRPEVHGEVSFQALAYLPFPMDWTEMHCPPNATGTSIQGINEGGIDYFVQFYTRERGNVLNSIWQRIKGMEAHIVNAVFSSRAKNLCTKPRDLISAVAKNALNGHAGSGLFSFAAVRCGYEFVWYQLAYRYFTVGRTAGSNYTLTSRNDNKYNPNCGQIFFFP